MPELSEISYSCQMFNLTPVDQDDNYIFQRDGTMSLTSKVSQGHLAEVMPEFIMKDDCPPQPAPQSPDCNPMGQLGLPRREGAL
jgi:hypothetical protein